MHDRLESASDGLEIALDRWLQDNFAIHKSGAEESTALVFQRSTVPAGLLSQVTLFQQKIQRAKSAIGFARNYSPKLVPIHRLPPILISRIFHYCASTTTCPPDDHGPDQFSNCSVGLSHVCTYWRRIAIALPKLWSHIDISLNTLIDGTVPSRIQTFLSRTRNTALDLHIKSAIHDDGGNPSRDQANVTLKELIAPLLPRIGGLKFRFVLSRSPSEQDSAFCQSLLANFLNRDTTLKGLTMLDITVNSGSRTFYIQTTEHPQNEDALVLDIPAQKLEDLLSSVAVLGLSNIVPHWTSKAFHGLVELRLHASDSSFIVHESQVAAALVHSPQLRVLDIGISIEHADTPFAPVALGNLEALITDFSSYFKLGRFLQLLETGSSPLFMSINYPYVDDALNDNIKDFFSRSNVTRLCTYHFYEFCKSLELVNLTHTIKELAMIPPSNDSWSLYNESESPVQVHLDTIYLLNSFQLDIDELRSVVHWPSVQKLVIWGRDYQVTRDGRPIINKQFLQKELLHFGTTVEILSTNFYPMDIFLL